jgi:tetratricopeptide (TPR) repeat protein
MFENSVALDPKFALAYAAIANSCAQYHNLFEREAKWVERATAASERASALGRDDAEVLVAEAWVLYMKEQYEESERRARRAVAKKPDAETAYYLLGRALFAAGRYQEIIDMADEAIAHSGDNYNIYIPYVNALGALGKNMDNARQQRVQVLQAQLSKVPEDARARVLLAGDYASMNRADDALREANMAMALRPNDALVMYNVACCFCELGKKDEALSALRKAYDAGFRDAEWTRRDPDLALLRDDPEFERMYPAG